VVGKVNVLKGREEGERNEGGGGERKREGRRAG
jgi:hypothetical protein